ncbi:MAG: zinc-ribbon domain-containing protein [Lachnospiraceae bacterium]|nr:zinc-ribbon domain-containing protein [Lachnospiraceae bacterium]
MVNCKNCGAPLTLNDAFCPYCGTPNPEAQEHLKKLQQLDAQFENASREVATEVKKSKKGYGILLILVMLLVANLVVFILHFASYDIADRIIAGKMSEAEIKAKLDEFLDASEYIEMDLFMDKFSLSYRDYEDYSKISYLAGYQNRMIEYMTQYLYGTENYGDPLVRTCQAVLDYEEEYVSLMKRENSEKALYHMDKINTEVNGFLKSYLKLTDEDIAGIKDMSESSLLILVNERLSHED